MLREGRPNVRVLEDDDDVVPKFFASKDIVHAAYGYMDWSVHTLAVVCCQVTFGAGATYISPTTDAVNCLECIAELKL